MGRFVRALCEFPATVFRAAGADAAAVAPDVARALTKLLGAQPGYATDALRVLAILPQLFPNSDETLALVVDAIGAVAATALPRDAGPQKGASMSPSNSESLSL